MWKLGALHGGHARTRFLEGFCWSFSDEVFLHWLRGQKRVLRNFSSLVPVECFRHHTLSAEIIAYRVAQKPNRKPSARFPRDRAAPTVSYLWPTRLELSWKVSENRKFLGRDISVTCPGSCRVREIQITSCPSKKELLTHPISVICTGVVPARGIISEAPFFWFTDFLICEAGAKKDPIFLIFQNCLRWGRSNLVDPAESPKIRLLNRDFGNILSIFLTKNSKT